METVLHRFLDSVVVVHINFMPCFHHIKMRTSLLCLAKLRSRTHAKSLGLITGRDANSRINVDRYNHRRFSLKPRLFLLLHRSEVRIHVDKEPVDLLRGLAIDGHEINSLTGIANKKRICLADDFIHSWP